MLSKNITPLLFSVWILAWCSNTNTLELHNKMPCSKEENAAINSDITLWSYTKLSDEIKQRAIDVLREKKIDLNSKDLASVTSQFESMMGNWKWNDNDVKILVSLYKAKFWSKKFLDKAKIDEWIHQKCIKNFW